MTMHHKCTNCKFEYVLRSAVFLKSGWGRSVSAGFRPMNRQLDDYQKVVCPKCGHIDKDERILSYGLLKPRTVIYIVLTIIFLILGLDFFRN
jgi:ssDNA-binding Zn-finger/Zn-ribbon topoisomerase 1